MFEEMVEQKGTAKFLQSILVARFYIAKHIDVKGAWLKFDSHLLLEIGISQHQLQDQTTTRSMEVLHCKKI